MCEVDNVTSQLLEISKQLAISTRSFTLTFKTKDIDFSFSSQGKEKDPKHPGHEKKKSPSQKKCDFHRRKQFLEKKMDKSNLSLKLCDNDKTTRNHTEEMAPPFKCDDCDFEGISSKGLQIHKGKQHKIAQIDGMDEDIKVDVSVQTEDSHLNILEGEVADDPDDDDLLPVGETFWPFPEVIYFDQHFHSLRRAPEGCWVNCVGDIKDIKTGEVKENVKLGEK